MKYKIISSKKTYGKSKSKSKILRLQGYNTLSRMYQKSNMLSESGTAFGFGIFYEPDSKEENFFSVFFKRVSENIGSYVAKAKIKREQKRKRRENRPSPIPAICGALCGALTVSLISAGVVLYKLVGEDIFGEYENISIPSLIGQHYPYEQSFDYEQYCNFTVNYEYSSTVPEGEIISQSPAAGVSRRIYPKRELCHITLTVSLGKRSITMNDYAALSARDAVLDLKNEEIKYSLKKEYSDTVALGNIISTEPAAGEIFPAERTVILHVSLGPETVYVKVPELYGLSEPEALEQLTLSTLTLGCVTYVRSALPYGTVIFQSHPDGTGVPQWEKIDITVSAGNKYNEKSIPDLYGLTIEQAKDKLAEYGLVCGRIYSVANGASEGTVIAQTPLPETPITSETVSVDIYVSVSDRRKTWTIS